MGARIMDFELILVVLIGTTLMAIGYCMYSWMGMIEKRIKKLERTLNKNRKATQSQLNKIN